MLNANSSASNIEYNINVILAIFSIDAFDQPLIHQNVHHYASVCHGDF